MRDNGIGILPDMLPRLFDMFAQERRNGVGAQEGLGIGLCLAYRLLQMHAGTIEARSEGKDRGQRIYCALAFAGTIRSWKKQRTGAGGSSAVGVARAGGR